jgi:hypothetical protein
VRWLTLALVVVACGEKAPPAVEYAITDVGSGFNEDGSRGVAVHFTCPPGSQATATLASTKLDPKMVGPDGKVSLVQVLPDGDYALAKEVRVDCAKDGRVVSLTHPIKLPFLVDGGSCLGMPCVIDKVRTGENLELVGTSPDPSFAFSVGDRPATRVGDKLRLTIEPAPEDLLAGRLGDLLDVEHPLVVTIGGLTTTARDAHPLEVEARPFARAHFTAIAERLAKQAKPGKVAKGKEKSLILLDAGSIASYGADKPLGKTDLLAVVRFVTPLKELNCATYAGPMTVRTYDGAVVVYDLAAGTVVGPRTFQGGGGSCPKKGDGGGFAHHDAIHAYAASFVQP